MSIYASPMSFSGSGSRTTQWAKHQSIRRHWAVGVLVWTLAITFLMMAWAIIVSWYMIIYGLFGLWFIPYRLIRRGQRQRKAMVRAWTQPQESPQALAARRQKARQDALQRRQVNKAANQEMFRKVNKAMGYTVGDFKAARQRRAAAAAEPEKEKEAPGAGVEPGGRS